MNEQAKALFDLIGGGLPRTKVTLSCGREIQMRAFTVKELKLLMMAYTSESAQDAQIMNVLQQCIITEGVNVETLPSIDVEKMYVAIYSLSRGSNMIPIKFTCKNKIESEQGEHTCNKEILVNMNLGNLDIENTAIEEIDLDTIVLKMRQPNVLEMEYFNETLKDAFNLSMRCVKEVITKDGQKYIVGSDISVEELAQIVEMLPPDSLEKIIEFSVNIPTVSTKVDVICPNCGHKEQIKMVGLSDLFG